MNKSLKFALSAAVFSAAIAGSAFAAQNNSVDGVVQTDTFVIPVPETRPLEMAQASDSNGAASGTDANGSDAGSSGASTGGPATGDGAVSPVDPLATGNIDGGAMTVEDFAALDVSKIDVKQVSEMPADSPRVQPNENDPATASLQQNISSNPALVEALAAKNVEVGSVVSSVPNADGSVTFYVK